MFTNNSLLTKTLLGGLLTLLSISMSAQNVTRYNTFTPHFQVGLNVGSSVFFGDIKQNQFWPATSNDISEWKYGGGLNLNYQISPSIGVRANGMYGQLTGFRLDKDLYFNSNYWETNLNATFNFNNMFGKNRVDRFFSFYGTLGVGITQYTTYLKTMSENVTVRTVGVEMGSGIKGRTLQGIALYGLGCDFRVNDRFNIQLESTNRVMDSDVLDGFQMSYPLDTYNYTSLGFTYKFGFNKRKLEEADAAEMEIINSYLAQKAEEEAAAKLEELIIPMMILDELELIEQEMVEEVKKSEELLPVLEYRVQILAKFEGPLSVKYISTAYLIPMYELKEEIYNGHFIYTVGSFGTYEEARRKRDELRRLFDITDAFVVAFDEASRLDILPEAE